MRSRLIRWAEHSAGVRVLEKLTHGIELQADLRARLPGRPIRTLFDVGASKGRSAKAFAADPGAQILSFEPVRSTFDRLVHTTRGRSRVSCFHLAFGAVTEDRRIVVRELSPNHSLHNVLHRARRIAARGSKAIGRGI